MCGGGATTEAARQASRVWASAQAVLRAHLPPSLQRSSVHPASPATPLQPCGPDLCPARPAVQLAPPRPPPCSHHSRPCCPPSPPPSPPALTTASPAAPPEHHAHPPALTTASPAAPPPPHLPPPALTTAGPAAATATPSGRTRPPCPAAAPGSSTCSGQGAMQLSLRCCSCCCSCSSLSRRQGRLCHRATAIPPPRAPAAVATKGAAGQAVTQGSRIPAGPPAPTRLPAGRHGRHAGRRAPGLRWPCWCSWNG